MTRMAPVLPMSEPDALAEAARELRDGGLVAFATDTVYGVGALPTGRAAAALYAAKGRAPSKPLPLLVASAELVTTYAAGLSPAGAALAAAYWPGPLTLVLDGRTDLAAILGSRDGSIGVRVPDHAPLRRLLELSGGALAVSSANRSGGDEATSAWEAEEQLGEHLALILDGGPSRNPFPSTVVDVRADPPVILRQGLAGHGVRDLIASLRPSGAASDGTERE